MAIDACPNTVLATTKCLANVKEVAALAVAKLNFKEVPVPFASAFLERTNVVEFVIDSIVVSATIPAPVTVIPTTREDVAPLVTIGLVATVLKVLASPGIIVEKVKVVEFVIDATVAVAGIPVPTTPIPTAMVDVVPEDTEFVPVVGVKVCTAVLE